MRRMLMVGLAALLPLLSGCGAIINLALPFSSLREGPYVYGGTRIGISAIDFLQQPPNSASKAVFVLLVILDLPPSFVVDTATLPITIPCAIARHFMDECPRCGKPIEEDATFCPHCGSDPKTGWKTREN